MRLGQNTPALANDSTAKQCQPCGNAYFSCFMGAHNKTRTHISANTYNINQFYTYEKNWFDCYSDVNGRGAGGVCRLQSEGFSPSYGERYLEKHTDIMLCCNRDWAHLKFTVDAGARARAGGNSLGVEKRREERRGCLCYSMSTELLSRWTCWHNSRILS